VPAGREHPYVADFSTTGITRGKLAIYEKEKTKVIPGLVQDSNGNPSDDPGVLTRGGAILPLGGDLSHGSHKGFCLASFVDILSGVLSGAGYGPFVPPNIPYLDMPKQHKGKGIGHFFGAMRIDAFQDGSAFKQRMDDWIRTIKDSEPIIAGEKLLIPGDIERENEIRNKRQGIQLVDSVEKEFVKIANELKVNI
jgi:LDH2 family malate/lactate/ureidoglycolate dehydrogenase